MSDPLALLPFALAAGGGRIDSFESTTLIAAGVTLLPRSATLVRALGLGASAILLPPGAAFLTALAASDGRPVLLLNPDDSPVRLAAQLVQWRVGAVFTTKARSARLPAAIAQVHLDAVPHTADVAHGDRRSTIDLGSHFGLDLAGERDVVGRNEVCLIEWRDSGGFAEWSHRELLAAIRRVATEHGYTPLTTTRAAGSWSHVASFINACSVLYVGGEVLTSDRDDRVDDTSDANSA